MHAFRVAPEMPSAENALQPAERFVAPAQIAPELTPGHAEGLAWMPSRYPAAAGAAVRRQLPTGS